MGGHTPGPWSVFDKGKTQAVMNSAGRQVVAWPGFDSSDIRDGSERRANLVLITAAPEMYEALKQMLATHSSVSPEDTPFELENSEGWLEARKQATRAIAKAEGGGA